MPEMPNVQEIIVDLQLDVTDLDTAADKLEALGVIDKAAAAQFRAANVEIKNKETALKAALATAKASGTASKKTIDDLDKAVLNLTSDFVAGFQEGVTDALKEAGVSAEEFSDAIKTGGTEITKSSVTVKARLSEITKELQLLKSQGKDNTEQYRALTAEAGNLRDAIGDVSQEINNAAANSQALDGLLSAAQGIAGGFAVAQGTAALFGDESEFVQETLLRVNSAMAILQGLQAIDTVLKKESAAVRLVTNAQLAIENGLNSTSIVVRTGAAFAQRLLNAAMNANPILLFVSALIAVVAAMAAYISSARDSERRTAELNSAVEAATEGFNNYADQIRKKNEEIVSDFEKNGAIQSKILEQNLKTEEEINQKRSEEIARLRQILSQSRDLDEKDQKAASDRLAELAKERNDADVDVHIKGNELKKQLREEDLQSAVNIAEAVLSSTTKNSKAELVAAKEVARAKAAVDINAAGQNASEILRIQAELNDQLRDLDRAFNQSRQQDRIAGIEAALIKETSQREAFTIRQSQTEIDLQKRIIQEKANLELLEEGLSQKKILEIKTRAQADILKLQRDFNKQSVEETLQDLISTNNAQLAVVEITNKEKLNLTIDNILAQAAIEVEQNKGLSEKIKEINAKRDADIRAVRLASIQQTVNDEIALRAVTSGVDVRADEKLLAAQDEIRSAGTEREKRAIEQRLNVRRLSINEELALIDQVADRETANIDSRLGALNDSFEQGLISYRDYNLQYNQLTDQQAQVTENAEQRKRNAIAATEAKAKEQQKKIVDFTFAAARQNLAILEEFYQQQADREQARIDQQRERITALREAGAITEKEALARQKKLDAEERKLKIQQAKRNKALAVFGAIISTAQAVATALTAGPPLGVIFAAIYAALGAAQIALIISKPIPQFKHGKKDSYQGPGVVGEAGAELIERDGQMYIAPKKTIVWLGAKDKVFNPKETIAMLEKPGLQTSKVVQMDNAVVHGERLDYDKLGKVIARNTQGVSLNIDGYKDFVIQGHAFDAYLNNRRGYR